MSRTLKGSLVVCVVAAASALISAEARAAATMINASPRAEKVNAAAARKATPASQSVVQREKWVGSRAIIFDPSTKSLRKPTENEVAQMVDSLRKMTTSKPKSFLTPRVQSAGGARQAVMEGELANVIIARSAADGSTETRCVQTFEEAAEFLGLVMTSSKPGEN